MPRTPTTALQAFRCIECGAEFSFRQTKYLCPDCRGNLQVVYD